MVEKHFQWKPEYSVNVTEIDDQHKKFISILDDLYQAILVGKQKEKLYEVFEKLEEYMDLHFSTEENYFDKFKYEGSDEHRAEHKKLKNKVEDIKQKAKNNEDVISFELVDFLEDWLLDHLAALDKKYTKCFNEHGLY